MTEFVDEVQHQLFIWWLKLRRKKCTGWIDLSFTTVEWAHWMFTCKPDCPMQRKSQHRRRISFEIYKRRNLRRQG